MSYFLIQSAFFSLSFISNLLAFRSFLWYLNLLSRFISHLFAYLCLSSFFLLYHCFFVCLNLWFYYFNNQLILNHTNDVNLFLFLVKVFRLDGLMCQTLLRSLAISSLKVFFMNYKPVCINTARLFYLHIFLLFNLIRTNTFIFY